MLIPLSMTASKTSEANSVFSCCGSRSKLERKNHQTWRAF